MREEHIKHLVDKYKKGLTSLEEEELLCNIDDSGVNKITSFAKRQKIEIPTNMNEKLWNSFDKKITKKSQKPIWKWIVAASVLLIVSFYGVNNHQNKLKEAKKQALLEEAKQMFANYDQSEKINSILFEDETIIVYTKTEY